MILKQIPQDFVVKEVRDIKTGQRGKYAIFLMQKTNYTTIKAVKRIADAMRKGVSDFSVSGMKDKDGITEQYVAMLHGTKEGIARVKVKDIRLRFAGYSDEKIQLASHKANSFEITARGLKRQMKPIKWMCNYYDDQRFGGIRPNMAKVGRLLIEEDYEGAMKHYLCHPFPAETEEHRHYRNQIEKNWGDFDSSIIPGYLSEKVVVEHLERFPTDYTGAFTRLPKQILTLFIHAYQSKLFNDILAAYIEQNCSNLKYIDYCLGKLPVTSEHLEVQVPLIGYDFECKGEMQSLIQGILERENLEPKKFNSKIYYSRTLFRPASVELQGLTMRNPEKDELNKGKLKQKISFSLETGSFATIAMKTMEQVS